MNMSNEEFRKSFTSSEKRLYLEVALSDMLNIDFDLIHSNIIVDDPNIMDDEEIALKLRDDAIVLTFDDYIIVVFKNNSLAEKKDDNIEHIIHNLSYKFPKKQICAININDFEE